MLSEGALMYYAIDQRNADKGGMEIELLNSQKQVMIEEWSYSPQLFAKDGIADSISVVLSFSDNNDKRIQIAVEEMLNVLWKKIDG